MGMDRRKFMKIAGISAIGVGGVAQPASRLLGREVEGALEKAPPLHAKRWAMVIDLKKCNEAGDCTGCIDACNQVHNVPDFDNPKDEVK